MICIVVGKKRISLDLTNQKPSFCLAASEHIRELVRLQIEDPDGEKVRYLLSARVETYPTLAVCVLLIYCDRLDLSTGLTALVQSRILRLS